MGSFPFAFKYSLARLKCLFPKNPLYADNGEGWAEAKTKCLLRSMKAPFFWAKGTGKVDSKLCVSAEFSFAIVEKTDV